MGDGNSSVLDKGTVQDLFFIPTLRPIKSPWILDSSSPKNLGFCCCRFCKCVFESGSEFLLHLSYDGFCRDGADSCS